MPLDVLSAGFTGNLIAIPVAVFATTFSIILAHRIEGRIIQSKEEDGNDYWRLRRKLRFKLKRPKVVCPDGHPLA